MQTKFLADPCAGTKASKHLLEHSCSKKPGPTTPNCRQTAHTKKGLDPEIGTRPPNFPDHRRARRRSRGGLEQAHAKNGPVYGTANGSLEVPGKVLVSQKQVYGAPVVFFPVSARLESRQLGSVCSGPLCTQVLGRQKKLLKHSCSKKAWSDNSEL